jgi:hypothetical protein
MTKKVIFLLVAFLLLVSPLLLAAVEDTVGINEGEFVLLFNSVLGLNKELSPQAKPEDHTKLLSHYGISPIEGYSANRPLTLGRLATILIRAKKIKYERLNDTDYCFSNVSDTNREWFSTFKNENRWVEIDEILKDRPKCPFGENYTDIEKDHLIDLHLHPDIENTERSYIELAIKNNIPIPHGPPNQVVSRAQVKETIRNFSGEVALLKLYLTPATPILPKDVAEIKMPKGYLIFAVYENGSAFGRKVNWKPTWKEGGSIEATVSYANDASLTGHKSIVMYINGIEAHSSAGKWAQDLSPDDYICIGSQSQTGKFPADAVLFDFKISNKTALEEILTDEHPVLFSKLDSLFGVTSLKEGLGGQLSGKVAAKKDVFKGEGFLSVMEGQYILFPVQNLNHLRGAFSLKIRPNFVSSKDEHAFLSTVRWDAKGGADGFYLYYQPEEKKL